MEKIKAMLIEMGGSPELVDKIMESLDTFTTSVETQKESELQGKLEKAKTVCLEEVEEYKRDLARKVQIFFESKTAKIEESIAKQVAIRESAAEAKLQKITALLEGIEVNGEVNNEALQAAKKELVGMKAKVSALAEERTRLAAAANRANQIAEKVLKRNHALETSLREGKSKGNKEEAKKACEKCKKEPCVCKADCEGVEPKQTVEESKTVIKKTGEKAKTGEAIIDETIRHAPAKKPVSATPTNSYTIENIADNIE